MHRLPCLLYKYCKRPLQQKKKIRVEAYLWKAGTRSGHTTNLKQSIWRLSISMEVPDRDEGTSANLQIDIVNCPE